MNKNKILKMVVTKGKSEVFERLKEKGYHDAKQNDVWEYSTELLQTGKRKRTKWIKSKLDNRYFQVISLKHVTGYKQYHFIILAEKMVDRDKMIYLSIAIYANTPKPSNRKMFCLNCDTPKLKELHTASGYPFCAFCLDRKTKKAFFPYEN